MGINTVNHLLNTGYFRNNQPATANNCTPLPAAGASANELQFDGLTTVLTAVATVIPCSTYHIKLKIGDVGDGVFDSAVFLKAGSFDGGGNASLSLEVAGNPDDDTATEGCENAKFIFTRSGTSLNLPVVVNYTISGTATSGADYAPIPGSILIPAGQTMAMIPVNVINDGIAESVENLRIKLLHPCSCSEPYIDLFIEDYNPMILMSDTVQQCGPGVVNIEPTVTYGVEPYTYNWNTGQNTPNISPFVNVSQNYTLTVTDFCGKTKSIKTYVNVYPPPKATGGGQAFLCNGTGTANLTINFSGGGPWTFTYSYNGVIEDPIGPIYTSPYILTVDQPGIYALVDCTNEEGCDGAAVGVFTVLSVDMSITGIVTDVLCGSSTNGSINTTVTGGSPAYTYKWTPVLGNIADPVNLGAGTYTVTVTDSHQCTATNSFTIKPGTILTATPSNIVTADCAHPTGGGATANVTGGQPGYTYLWSNGASSNPLVNVGPGNVTVTITDAQGCTVAMTVAIPGDFAPPTANAAANGQITCQNQNVPMSGAGSSSGPNISYQWTTVGGAFSGPTDLLNAIAVAPGQYSIVVTDSNNGCTATKSVDITASADIPAANASAPDPLTCTVSTVGLSGAGTATGPGITYQWSGPGLAGDPNSLNPSATAPGTYTLVVSDANSGCTNTSQAVVDLDNTLPQAVIAQPGILNCTSASVILNAIGTSTGPNFTYQWTGAGLQSGQTTLQPTVTAAGTFTILVTNTTNGCTTTTSTTVGADNSLPTAVIAQPTTLTCTTQQFSLDASGSSFGGNFDINWTTVGGNYLLGTNGLNPTINAPGQYVLTITNLSSQCTATANVTVGQNIATPVADAGQPQELTCALLSAQIGTASSPNLTYNWSGAGLSSNTVSNPTASQQGTYYLTVTDTANGCTADASVVISENNTAPQITVAPGGQLTCQVTSMDLSAAGSSAGPNFLYQWTASNGGTIDLGDKTQTPTISSPGTYSLLITDTNNSCTATASTTVTQSAGVPVIAAAPDGVISCKNPDVIIDATGTSTGASISYEWSTTNGFIVTGVNDLQLTVNAPGDYKLLVQNTNNGCSATSTITVGSDLTPPAAEAGPGATLSCGQSSATLDGTGSSAGANFTYQWAATNGGTFTSNSNLTGLSPTATAAGTYTIVVTNGTNGCTASDDVIINQAPDVPVAVVAPAATLTCAVTSIDLSGTGSSTGAAYSYLWTTLNGTISNGNTSLAPTVTKPGTYQLAVTDNVKGCTSLASVTVAQDTKKPDIQAGPPGLLTCIASQTTLTGTVTGPGNFTYLWTGGTIQSGATTLTPTVTAAGTYTLQVTDQSNGCTSTATTTVTSNMVLPTAAIEPPTTINCNFATAELDATASSTGQFSYNWAATNGGKIDDLSNPLVPIVSTAGTYNLTVTNNLNGCTATASVVVIEDKVPPTAVIAAPGQLTCAVQTLTLSGTGSSAGAPGFTYQWTTANGKIDNGATTLSPTISKPGDYKLVVKNTSNGCTATASASVTANTTAPLAVVGTPGELTCTKKTVTLSGVGSASGPGITYSWATTNGNITTGPTTLTPVVDKIGTYVLTVFNSNNGCSSTAQATVGQNIAAPTVDAGNPSELTCANPTASLIGTASPQTNVAWTAQPGNIVSGATSLTPTVNAAGTYTITATSTVNGCTATDKVVITAQTSQPTDLQVNLTIPSCQGDGIIAFTGVTGGVEPYVYSIDGGKNWFSAAQFDNVLPGQYDLWVQDVNGCKYHEPLAVPQPAIPELTMVPEIQLNFGDSITLDAKLNAGFPLNQVDTIIWTPTTGLTFAGNSVNALLHPSVKPVKNSTYKVTLISVAGCQTTASVNIKVDRDPHVYIPNAISPWNAEGLNDQLIIFANPAQVLEITAFEMFDRWGDKVWADYGFQPNEPAHGWSSVVRNKQLNPGVYVYWANIKFIDNREVLYKGDVTIVR